MGGSGNCKNIQYLGSLVLPGFLPGVLLENVKVR